jgi:hypothetical protein
MHTQYNLFYQIGVFASGLLLGHLATAAVRPG